MYRNRVIPCLTIIDKGLVKTEKFKKAKYVGDPVNAVKIFNEKEVDELIILDISATKEGRGPDFDLIEDIASECFMPICYGGGIRNIDDVKKLFSLGIEKISINTSLVSNIKLVKEVAKIYGSQAVVASIDCKKKFFKGYKVISNSDVVEVELLDWVKEIEQAGAGEILLTSIDNDGVKCGYDLDLISLVSRSVNIPVISCGGANNVNDMKDALAAGASAVAAGSMFVFHGKHRAVLISYLSPDEMLTGD